MKVIEAFIDEKEAFVVDNDLSGMYCVSLDWSPKTKPKFFKELKKAEEYAQKALKDSIQKKTIVSGKSKTVTIAKGSKIIKKLSPDNL